MLADDMSEMYVGEVEGVPGGVYGEVCQCYVCEGVYRGGADAIWVL